MYLKFIWEEKMLTTNSKNYQSFEEHECINLLKKYIHMKANQEAMTSTS